jgi:multidrug efflux system outer membrane protein
MRGPRVRLSLALLPLAGCTVGPDYVRPPVVTPETWRAEAQPDPASLANAPWWELLADPQLAELIRIALVENRDLRIAAERMVEYRARLGVVRADAWPQVDAGVTVGAFDLSAETLDFTGGEDIEDEVYSISAEVSWEIDVFGRIRRATEAQRARLLATEEARRAVAIGLVADVARVYFELRDADRRLEISRRTLESRREYVELAQVRFEGGVTSEVDWRQAQAELHRTESFVEEFEKQVRQRENELSVLLGRNPGSVTRGASIEDAATPPAVPAGLPSELLERRPDLRAAEQQLVAANADIGQAKALLYPRIALTASYGLQSLDLDTLFDSSSKAFTVFGNLLQPIFNKGKNRRRVEVTESVMRQTLYQYEQSVLLAFREVEDTLIAYGKAGEQRASQGRRVEAERKVLELAEVRYRGGVTDYLEILDSQRSLFDAELDHVEAIRSQLVSLVRLYKALGGGWPPAPETDSETDSDSAP